MTTTAKHPRSIADDADLLEVIDASNTVDLHKSNLMRLQVDELLTECHIHLADTKWSADAQTYIQTLLAVIGKMPDIRCANRQHQADKMMDVQLQAKQLLVEPFGLTKTPAGWTKPSGDAHVLPTFTFFVKLPSALFGAKDYLNHRYFDKCQIVRDSVAKHLAKHAKQLGTITFQQGSDGRNAPYLQLVPNANNSSEKKKKKRKPSSSSSTKRSKFQIHLHFGMESIDWIQPQLRLVPNRCNIKASITNNPSDTCRFSSLFASQMYNHELAHQARHRFLDRNLSELGDHLALAKTLILLQVWCLQRGLWRNHDGWSKESFGVLLVYLLRTHHLNARMTPVQIMTIVLQFLVSTSWLGSSNSNNNKQQSDDRFRASQNEIKHEMERDSKRTVLVLPLDGGMTEQQTIRKSKLAATYQQQTKESPLTDNDPKTLLQAYASTATYHLGPVFLDPTMTYNYLGFVSPNYMRTLQLHAQHSLQYIQTKNAFTRLFLTPSRFWQQWDVYVRIPCNKQKATTWEASTRRLLRTLRRALNNRVRGMRVLSTGNGDLDKGAAASNNDGSMDIADSIPTFAVNKGSKHAVDYHRSPTATDSIILGLALDPETSQRLVDRGPPSDQIEQVQDFVSLWGDMAQLRRFKDGAIVQAVIWTESGANAYQNEDKLQGSIVQRIVRHIVKTHYTKSDVQFSFPQLLSAIDGVKTTVKTEVPYSDPISAHRNLMKTFETLAEYLKKNSQPALPGERGPGNSLGLPLPINAVQPLSPALRYSELFPPLPHPFLGGQSFGQKKVSGAVTSNPILIQIRFGASSKWPTDFKAMGAAKTAMLLQVAKGIEDSNAPGFSGHNVVTPSYFEFGYKGYCFRTIVRADQEMNVLQNLYQPTPEALSTLLHLQQKHIVASLHHATIHSVHTLHPSASAVVRLAQRWVAGHLLSGHISIEIIELIAAKVYSDNPMSPLGPPSSAATGFLQWLRLLAKHDWEKSPLIVDPREYISEDDADDIVTQFHRIRGDSSSDTPSGLPMYIIAPFNRPIRKADGDDDDNNVGNVTGNANAGGSGNGSNDKQKNKDQWTPSIKSPEWVVLYRARALAQRSHNFLMQNSLKSLESQSAWESIFHESASSFQSYSALMRVDPDFVFDKVSSSTGGESLGLVPSESATTAMASAYTRSLQARCLIGPKPLRKNCYRNLQNDATILLHWTPIEELMTKLQDEFGHLALFFCNYLSPEVIGVVWRPKVITESQRFSVMASEYAHPVSYEWKSDTMIKRSQSDILRDMKQYYNNIVTTVKVMVEDSTPEVTPNKSKKNVASDDSDSDDSDGDGGAAKTSKKRAHSKSPKRQKR